MKVNNELNIVLDLSYEEASEALERCKLLRIVDDDRVDETGAMLNVSITCSLSLHTVLQISCNKIISLQALGIAPEDIANYPEILSNLATTIENHALLLYECGFKNVTACELQL